MTYREHAMEDRSRLIVTVNGKVAALDMQSGREVWRNNLSGAGVGAVEVLVVRGTVLVAPESNVLVALDYATGAERWRAVTTGTGRAAFLTEDPRLIVARGGYVDCFDLEGHKVWSNGLQGMGIGATGVALPGNARQADAGRQ